jgi:hypothetical protein
MKNIFVGIDNGATGSIGLIDSDGNKQFFPTPVKQVPNYTKEVHMIGRINVGELKIKLINFGITKDAIEQINVRALIERPFMAPVDTIIDQTGKKVPTVNMNFLKASLNAHRAFEATLILMESMKIGYEIVDSKAWQKEMLGSGIKGSKNLKEASKLKGIQMFPEFELIINKHKDADGLLIAAFAQRYYNQS